jgi:two-component system sensor histidine kinase RegB
VPAFATGVTRGLSCRFTVIFLRRTSLIRSRDPALVFNPLDAHALVTTLAWLRPCAALGQALAIVAAIGWLRIALPLQPLIAGIAVMMVAALLGFWRLRQAWSVGEVEAVCHVGFDLLLLAWALYFTGGASNPFITLLLVPVALAATTLSARDTALVVLLAAAAYAVLMFRYVPLPDISTHGSAAGFRLHLTGMAINFLIAALLLTVFIGRMTALLRAQREATRALRERMLRDEGILAVATQAAEAAHELNTPLSTLRTLLPELERDGDDAALRDDVRLMLGEVDRCRAILRRMVDYGRQQLSGKAQATTLGDYVHANVERFRLLCPEAEVSVSVPARSADYPIEAQPGLAHALLNLMHNAFDASSENASRVVTLDAAVHAGHVEFVIGDRGNGLPDFEPAGVPKASSKAHGLGLGLALARSTIERLRGELHADSGADGTRIHVRLPSAGGAPP